MKNFHLHPLLSMCAMALVFSSCSLDTEPEIPAGGNNIEKPVFLSSEAIPDTQNNFQAKARLSSLGNLNILHHGWVWSEAPAPTLLNGSLVLGRLFVDSFSTEIPGLDLGKIYYLRPVVITGCDTIYAPELCSFLGVNFTINTDAEIFQGADVQFTNTTPCNNCTYIWDFGDGNPVSTTSPKHTFNTTGNITVRLSATNSGCTVTRDIILKVVDDPFQGYWVDIPGGTFMMGCTAEQEPCGTDELETPVHQVSLDSFFLGKTEITQGQWLAVVGDNPSLFAQCGPDCPVEHISWHDIKDEFIPALYGKTGRMHRLPTEAEWEYAARGGQAFKYAGSDDLPLVGWYDDSITDTVAQRLPNGYGTYDMSGNVWEWVEDDYHDSYIGAPANGSAWIDEPPSLGRMYRGGSWQSVSPDGCRIANRAGDLADTKSNRIGFRLAR